MSEITKSDCIYPLWEEFVTTGHVSKPHLIRKEILESWKRSREMKVDPFKKFNPIVLSPEELRERQRSNADLISVAEPIMKKLHNLIKFKNSEFVITLNDSDGFLIKVIGDPKDIGFFSNLNEGTNWLESTMGTNALGTALVIGGPIQVHGAEHYCLCAHPATCSSAPIYGPEGAIIGVLNATGREELVHPHTLGMIAAAADAITTQLRLMKLDQQKHIILESLSEGIVVVDRNGLVTHLNGLASKMLKLDSNFAVGKKIDSVIETHSANNKHFLEIITSEIDITDEIFDIDTPGGTFRCNVTVRPLVSKSSSREGTVVAFSNVKCTRSASKCMMMRARYTFDDIIGEDPSFLASLKLAQKVASSDVTVLITGESGTGKDILVQAIHNASKRRNFPFVAINCGAIPRELLESELFGYEEGAFTGARKGGNIGKIELADGGTLFLDEIGEMPLDMQVALLRVLEERSIVRIGGKKLIPVNVRVIAATNCDLAKMVSEGKFRADLFYRLNVINIKLPPLRERRSDIPLLVREFARRLAGTGVSITPDAMSTLLNYNYPGNIRELRNIVEYTLAVSSNSVISRDVLPRHVVMACPTVQTRVTGKKQKIEGNGNSLRSFELNIIKDTISECNGNISLAAKKLGVSRSTIYRKLGSEISHRNTSHIGDMREKL